MYKTFKIFEPFQARIKQGYSVRKTGSFAHHPETLEKIIGTKGVLGKQIHSDIVLRIKEIPQEEVEGDAWMTQSTNLPLAVKVADCQGALIYDSKTNSIASIHSGWKGSIQNIIGKTIRRMKDEYGSAPEDLYIGISPSLGPCCAEFTDPEKELPKFAKPYIKGRNVDFWKMSLDQCLAEGVPKNQIEIPNECTKCNSDQYYSYRKGDEGRIAVFISLKEQEK